MLLPRSDKHKGSSDTESVKSSSAVESVGSSTICKSTAAFLDGDDNFLYGGGGDSVVDDDEWRGDLVNDKPGAVTDEADRPPRFTLLVAA
jgi:hypothetical protein